ncbi:MAG: cell division protein YceG involved in septum cleavage [Chlamydiales bacterium]
MTFKVLGEKADSLSNQLNAFLTVSSLIRNEARNTDDSTKMAGNIINRDMLIL